MLQLIVVLSSSLFFFVCFFVAFNAASDSSIDGYFCAGLPLPFTAAWLVVQTVADPTTFRGDEERSFSNHSLTCLIPDLLPGSAYHFRVFSTNSVGVSWRYCYEG